ncbi:MAG: cytochrome D1 domain-containing protein [Blastocatellia bacterium]
MMKNTKLRAHRFAVIRNNAAVSVLTFTLAFAPVAARAAQSQPAQSQPAQSQPAQSQPAQSQSAAAQTTTGKQTDTAINRGRLVQEGMAIEYAIESTNADALTGGDNARVQFKLTDAATNKPVTGLRPAAWLDYRTKKEPVGQQECKEKVRAFLQGSLGARPDVDLNSYFILALNKESSISVIDPIVTFGSSKLFTLVMLSNPGEDWRLMRDGRKLFVTIPMSNHVAVVDTATWKVGTNVEIGARPGRIVLQKDEKYAWVGDMPMTASPSGVTAIDTATDKVAARIITGTGQHEIVMSADDRFAFVSNTGEGTISVIDVQKLTKIKDIKIGVTTTGLAYSPLSKAVYAIDETTGAMIVIDAQSFEPIARLSVKPGIRTIRIAPGGRYGFILNPKANTAQIFDAASNRLLHTVQVGVKPDQVVFTEVFGYIRSLGSDEILLISLKDLDKVPSVQPTHIPAGQAMPETAGALSAAEAITPAPEGGSVLIANPADQTIYYYTEGMAAPMGNFQNYRREPRGVMVVDRSLRETSPGTYSANVKLPQGGQYDLAFLIDSPRVIDCFNITVKDNPAMARRGDHAPLLINYMVKSVKVRPHEKVNVQFRLRDPESGAAKNDLKDVGVLTFLAPGTWQERQWAKALGNGVYEIDFVPPNEGVYYIFVHCPSLKIKLNELPFIVLDGRAQQANAGTNTGNRISEKEEEK